MSDGKKNIGPEGETPTKAPAPEQLASDKAEPVVTDLVPAKKVVPAYKAESATPEFPASAALEQFKREKEAQQVATPDNGNPALEISGKMVDFAVAREKTA